MNETVITSQTSDSVPPLSPVAPPLQSPVASSPKRGNFLGVALVGVSVFIVVAGAIGYYLYTQQQAKQISAVPTSTPIVNQVPLVSTIPSATTVPSATPVTQTNVDQTLNNTDAAMQKSVDQANTDLNTINSINKTSDTTSGL